MPNEDTSDNTTNIMFTSLQVPIAPVLVEQTNYKKDIKDIRNSLIFKISNEISTYVIACAVSKDSSKNGLRKLSAEYGSPIGGFAYDSLHDFYAIYCADVLPLDNIPISCTATIEGLYGWNIKVPLSDVVIKRYLSPAIKNSLDKFRESYNKLEYDIKLVQMVA
jgi:hypothetical protein